MYKNTLKSRIVVNTIAIFIALIVIMGYYAFIYLKNAKALITESCSNSVSVYKQRINTNIWRIEDIAGDIALTGSIFQKTKKKHTNFTKNIIKNTFEQSAQGIIGGGIWFEPYTINRKEKSFFVYVYKNFQKQTQEYSKNYDYLNSSWYKQLSSQLRKTNKIVWSSPYFEKNGSNTMVITAGAGIYDSEGQLIGISTVDCDIDKITQYISAMKPTEDSFSLLANIKDNSIIISNDKYLDNKNLIGKSLDNIPWFSYKLEDISYFVYHKIPYISYVKHLDNDMVLITNVPQGELFYKEVIKVLILFIGLILVSIIISALLYYGLSRNILRPIEKLIQIANKIGNGEIDTDIKIDSPKEFAHLASTFNTMTKNIKTITAEKEKINSELYIAKEIQKSSLPNIESICSNQDVFDISAYMEPAKEVGGDFYDCYFIDKEHFMFLIADVSGKGIPAALFMMNVKSLISNISQEGYSPDDIIKVINNKIYKNNKQEFFVTMFAGILNISTGKITYINCGHNKPFIKSKNGLYKVLDIESNIVLGAFENFDFKIQEAQLEEGDTIFAYTDGITESVNTDGQMYGEKRLEEVINKQDDDIEKLLANIKNDVESFTNKAPQIDDITMLIFKYKNKNGISNTYKDLAIKENYKKFYMTLQDNYSKWNIDSDMSNRLEMCAEELYANISFYSYPKEPGFIEVTMMKTDNEIILKFEDEGVPYNPLEKDKPDITLPPEERPLGGLGIFIVREIADDVQYEYKNKKNILTLKFIKNKGACTEEFNF